MNYHLIAMGGAVMHNLAIALHQKGHTVTGSDDEIFDPAKSRLQALGLLPENVGWFPEKIHAQLDAVIVGMHARKDNPELARALELGIRVYSFPEFLYEHSRNKKRVVIGGSHGKTTITAMIMHVMRHCGIDFDYLVGSQVQGFDVMVRISETAQFMVFEGDEYLTAPFDPRPKFHLYHPHIALISGIAWDHINVFPDFEDYVKQFWIFAGMIEPGGLLIYNQEDELVRTIAMNLETEVVLIPYSTPDYRVKDNQTCLLKNELEYPLKVFGRHNLQNIAGAWNVCRECGVSDREFLEAITTYEGAARRLEKIFSSPQTNIFRDFAHSPSKLKATVSAVKEQYPDMQLIACMELHTFSSLSSSFLAEYSGCMDDADEAIVYFNPHTLQMKKLPEINPQDIFSAFAKNGLKVYTDSAQLLTFLQSKNRKQSNLLMMSSGNFDGLDLKRVTEKLPV
jgi:UDP-N-acetylmuramate: L-alanyl-gamma-D-glutamyl-meso-diaminopimelate ligase